jgi:hypothetical protein
MELFRKMQAYCSKHWNMPFDSTSSFIDYCYHPFTPLLWPLIKAVLIGRKLVQHLLAPLVDHAKLHLVTSREISSGASKSSEVVHGEEKCPHVFASVTPWRNISLSIAKRLPGQERCFLNDAVNSLGRESIVWNYQSRKVQISQNGQYHQTTQTEETVCTS